MKARWDIANGLLLSDQPVLTTPFQVTQPFTSTDGFGMPLVSLGKANGPYPDPTIQASSSLKYVSHVCGHRWIGRTSSNHMLTSAAPNLSSEAVMLTPKEQNNKGRNKKDLLDPENHRASWALHATLATKACMSEQLTIATSIPRAHRDLMRSEMI